MALPGYDALLTCSTGVSETYASLNGFKQFSVGDSRELLDITDFADGNVHARLAALRDVSLEISGDLEPTDTGYLRLKAAYEAGSDIIVQVYSRATVATAGFAYRLLVGNLDVEGSVEGKLEVSASLMINASAGTAIMAI